MTVKISHPTRPLDPGPTSAGFRRWLHDQLDPTVHPEGLSTLNRFLALLIVTATVLAALETEAAFERHYVRLFDAVEFGLGLVFLIEYLARIWVAPDGSDPGHPWRARLRFITSPAALTDLVAVIGSLAPVFGPSGVMLRLVRLFRILRLAKLGRMSRAFHHMSEAIASRREEMILSLGAGFFLMIVSATLLYLAEGSVQPEKFGSIPRALWWSVATFTTIGYGDVYPVTPLGKVLAAVTAVMSIGVIAMPTGILAAAFSDAMHRHRSQQTAGDDGEGGDEDRS